MFERILVEPLDPVLDETTQRTGHRVQFVLLHLVLESSVESQLGHYEKLKLKDNHIAELYC